MFVTTGKDSLETPTDSMVEAVREFVRRALGNVEGELVGIFSSQERRIASLERQLVELKSSLQKSADKAVYFAGGAKSVVTYVADHEER